MSRETAVEQYRAYAKVADPKAKPLEETLRRDAQTLQHGIERFAQEALEFLGPVVKDPRSVYINNKLDGVTAFYDRYDALRKAIGMSQGESEEPQVGSQRETRVESRGYRGNLPKDVRKYLAVRARQNRFDLKQVAKDFGMGNRSAPIYRIMQGVEYLKKGEIKGRIVFDRKR